MLTLLRVRREARLWRPAGARRIALSTSSWIFNLKDKTNSLGQKHIKTIIGPIVDDPVGRQEDEVFGTRRFANDNRPRD